MCIRLVQTFAGNSRASSGLLLRPPTSRDRLDEYHMTAVDDRRWERGLVSLVAFHIRLSYLISMASLTFPSNQLYYMHYLADTLTLSFVMLWCSCAQCSSTAVSGFLMLICSFILVASVLSVSLMYVRGIQGSTPGIPDNSWPSLVSW